MLICDSCFTKNKHIQNNISSSCYFCKHGRYGTTFFVKDYPCDMCQEYHSWDYYKKLDMCDSCKDKECRSIKPLNIISSSCKSCVISCNLTCAGCNKKFFNNDALQHHIKRNCHIQDNISCDCTSACVISCSDVNSVCSLSNISSRCSTPPPEILCKPEKLCKPEILCKKESCDVNNIKIQKLELLVDNLLNKNSQLEEKISKLILDDATNTIVDNNSIQDIQKAANSIQDIQKDVNKLNLDVIIKHQQLENNIASINTSINTSINANITNNNTLINQNIQDIKNKLEKEIQDNKLTCEDIIKCIQDVDVKFKKIICEDIYTDNIISKNSVVYSEHPHKIKRK